MIPVTGVAGSLFCAVSKGLAAGGALVPMPIVDVPSLQNSKWVFTFFGSWLAARGEELLAISISSLDSSLLSNPPAFFCICSPSGVGGMPILSAMKMASFFGVAVGVVAASFTAKGPKGDILGLGAGVPGSLKRLPLVAEGALDAMLVGEE